MCSSDLRQIGDRMRQFDHGVPLHAAAPKLMYGSVLENLREDHGRGDTPFFKLHGVVHTAQRTGTSSAHRCDGDIDLVRHLIEQFA